MKLKIFYLITLTLATFLVGCSSEVIQEQDAQQTQPPYPITSSVELTPDLLAKEEFIDLLNSNIDSYTADYEYSGSTSGGSTDSTYLVVVENGELISYEEVSDHSSLGMLKRTTNSYDGNTWQCGVVSLQDNTESECTYERKVITDSNLKEEALSQIDTNNLQVFSFETDVGSTCYLYGEEGAESSRHYGLCFRNDGLIVTKFSTLQLGRVVLNIVGYSLDEETSETARNAVS